MSEEIIQRTEEWYSIRIGRVTASRVADIMAKTKSGPSASRKNYMAELVCERLTGAKADGFTSSAMQWGIDHEEAARQAYEAQAFVDVVQVGFVGHPTIAMAGCSPDGLVALEGLVEIKCPNSAKHIETLLSREADKQYFAQMQMQMACTGRKWCDFVSFDPRLPADLQLFVCRVPRDDAFIAEMEKEITTFLAELDETVEKLRHYHDAPEPEAPAEPAKPKRKGRAA